MHDINGKTLHIGNEVFSYGFGLCKIVGVLEEDNAEKQGVLVLLQNDKGKQFEERTHAAYMKRVRSWKELAQVGLDVQNACNLSGVVHTFSEVVSEVRSRMEGEGKAGTDAVNKHPVCLLFSDKIASLTGTQTVGHNLTTKAYEWAYDLTASNRKV